MGKLNMDLMNQMGTWTNREFQQSGKKSHLEVLEK